MKYFQFIVCLSVLLFLSVSINSSSVNAYAFGTYPEDNNAQETLNLEQKYGIKNDVVGFIYDSFTVDDAKSFIKQVKLLGTDRVYHVSISPFGFTAKQVANGEYDKQYIRFFSIIKSLGIKVLFRTGHEMNGSWYSWSGSPEDFKEMWIHVYNLSRQIGLTNKDIQFIFSVNSQDLPSDGKGGMIFCSPSVKKKTKCLSFEDYFPGTQYVDLMGLTLYNWGRGRGEDWATWRSFDSLLNDSNTKMFSRLKVYGKKIFLDEVGTTAVDFYGKWSDTKAEEVYKSESVYKNKWLKGMKQTLDKTPEIVGVLYFNRDKTNGLTDRHSIGELDWSILSLRLNKEYLEGLKFFKSSTTSSLAFTK